MSSGVRGQPEAVSTQRRHRRHLIEEGPTSKGQHTGDIATIEMGARQYVTLLARFLSVDQVPGGNANDYN